MVLKTKGSTKDLVPIQKIIPEARPGSGAIAIMKDGSFRMLLRVGAVNFDMKSARERDALTWAFGALCNSLEDDFPIQICPHSKKLDISTYYNQFQSALNNPKTPPQIKDLIVAHQEHFQSIVRTRNLLSREFFLVIPWKGVTKPVEKSWTDDFPFSGLIKKIMDNTEKKLTQHIPSDLEISTAQNQLETRSSNIQDRLQQIGLWSEALGKDDLGALLWELFHSSRAERQKAPQGIFDGRMIGGFSAESVANIPLRSDGKEIKPPSF